jgi:Phage envelope protein
MNSHLVLEAARASLAGSLPFPEIVRSLIGAGVEYYHVDYISLRFTFYGAESDVSVAPITYEGLPSVAADFDVLGLRDAIRDSQQKGQHYREFSQRAMRAGVQSYFAFLRGQRVTYFGRQGDQHTEWFAGAGPRHVP